jgi:hypothetical protein
MNCENVNTGQVRATPERIVLMESLWNAVCVHQGANSGAGASRGRDKLPTMVEPLRDAEARRLARGSAEVRVFRPGESEAEADADALYWDRIPMNQRAAFVWQLSLELYTLANPGSSHEPGLSRSTARITGR